MVKLSKLYTKTGDSGTTGLVGGTRVKKESLRVKAYGEIDELNAFLGMARTLSEKLKFTDIITLLSDLQNDLFNLGSELATDPTENWDGMIKIGNDEIKIIEGHIDNLVSQVDELKSFVLPGGTELNSALHIARTISRRAERTVIELSREQDVSNEVLIYLNRLSDFLFALSRYATKKEGAKEYLWAPGKLSPVEK